MRQAFFIIDPVVMQTYDFGNKPFELAHALFRVAGLIKQKDLKSRIEAHSVYLVESAAASNNEAVANTLAVLEKLVVLGEVVGEINYQHSQVLYRQIDGIKSAIRQKIDNAVGKSLEIEAIFSEETGKTSVLDILKETENASAADITSANYQANPVRSRDGTQRFSASNWTKDRQALILERIRQLGNAAMKDMVAAFPEVSERTIRYDLQKLCEYGAVERVGSGGPASYYRVTAV